MASYIASLTISEVLKSNLCTGCGTCIGLCPRDAIELKINQNKGIYLPELNEDKCNYCGICYRVCPGKEIDFKTLNLEIFGKEPEDILIGNYLRCYIGHAASHDIRYNSSSGGLITALLIFALEEGLIDGVLVTRMRKDRPLEPEPFIARTKEEVIEASRSKYCPVPAGIMLRKILDAEDGEKFAVAGLPCHLHGLRKAQMVNAKLRERVILSFGIMCSHTDNFFATEYILNLFDIEVRDVKRLEYRGRGWPGSMLIEMANGDTKVINYRDYITVHELQMFIPTRCTMCYDGVAELSDLSFGDAWRIESNDEKGTSLCISRTDVGEKFIQHSIASGVVKLEEIDRNMIIGSQGLLSNSRLRHAKANIFLAKFSNKAYPKLYGKSYNEINPKLSDYFKFILLGINKKILSKKLFWGCGTLVLPIEKKLIGK